MPRVTLTAAELANLTAGSALSRSKSFSVGAGIGSVSGLVPLTVEGQKVSKESVRYRPAADPARSCGTCLMFRDGSCTLVAGPISPADVCDRWEARDSAKAVGGYSLSPRSGMISLDLPDGLIEPVPGGVSDFHVTVVYLGRDVDDEALERACQHAAAAAALVPGPLVGMLSGQGTFEPSAGSDGKVPVFIPARIPGAERLRATLADLSASEHKDWKPHVTRAYLEPGDPLPEPLPPVPVTFTHLTVHRGADVRHFPLGGA